MQQSLATLLDQRSLILVSGKGGVGKSTVTAILAELALRRFGSCRVVESSAHPRLQALVQQHPKLQCVNIDIEQALVGFLGRLMHLPQVLNALLRNRVVRLFLRTAPAVGEMVLLDAITQILQAQDEQGKRSPEEHGGPVIVDLPATGHALTLLSTPRAVRRMLRVGPVARLAEQLEQLLVNSGRCELVVVTLPEELPINESIEVIVRARELGISCERVLVNQVPKPAVELADREWLRRVGQQDKQNLGRAAQAACQDLAGADAAQQQIERLKKSLELDVIELGRDSDPDPRHQVQAALKVLSS